MKVLFVNNVASMQTITALGMNNFDNIESKCLIFTKNKYSTTNEVTVFEEIYRPAINPFKVIRSAKLLLTQKRRIQNWFDWADIIHYAWGPIFKSGKDLKWAKKTGKPIFVEWVGSDIRDIQYLCEINPHFNNYFETILKERKFNTKKVRKYLSQFNSVQAIPTLCPEMSLYIDKTMFSNHKNLFQRINLTAFKLQLPKLDGSKPLIIHSPTSPIFKGTQFVLDVISKLKTNYDFEFKLVTNMTRAEALEIMQKADIFIDQLILGSYGMASIEAMSYGKPVMTYIMPKVFEAGLPNECPIVNTNPINLEENLVALITDAKLRHELGALGRAYVKKYHDNSIVIPQLLSWYQEALIK